jgi:hypothetical protein
MMHRIDAHRPSETAAVATAEEKRPFAGSDQKFSDSQRRRRLASAAKGRVADAQHRYSHRFAGLAEASFGDCAVHGGEWGQQG